MSPAAAKVAVVDCGVPATPGLAATAKSLLVEALDAPASAIDFDGSERRRRRERIVKALGELEDDYAVFRLCVDHLEDPDLRSSFLRAAVVYARKHPETPVTDVLGQKDSFQRFILAGFCRGGDVDEIVRGLVDFVLRVESDDDHSADDDQGDDFVVVESLASAMSSESGKKD